MAYFLACAAIIVTICAYFFIHQKRKRQFALFKKSEMYWNIAQESMAAGTQAFNELLSSTKQSSSLLDRFIWDTADMFLGFRPVSRSAARNAKLYEVDGSVLFIDEPTTKAIAVFYDLLENQSRNLSETSILQIVESLNANEPYKYNLLKKAIMSLTIGVWYFNLLDIQDAFDNKIPSRIDFDLIDAIMGNPINKIRYEDVLKALDSVMKMKTMSDKDDDTKAD